MAHDTIYKRPDIAGFGSDPMSGIEARMAAIMRKHIAPAGYEFQKVLIDFERLESGKELFDRDVLAAIEGAADNNERHDLIERFSTAIRLAPPANEEVGGRWPAQGQAIASLFFLASRRTHVLQEDRQA